MGTKNRESRSKPVANGLLTSSKWFANHSPTHSLPTDCPSAAISPKMTRFELSSGNFHPQQPQALTRPPSTRMTRFNASLRAEDPSRQPPQQLFHPSSTISSKTTRFALLGGNHHPAPHSLTTGSTPELKSRIRTHDKCHTAQEQMDEPSGLDSSPPQLTKRSPTQFQPTFLMEREGKWVVAGAQHHPSCFEGKQESKDDANHIAKGQKGGYWARNHSLSELTHQTHPLPPIPTRSTCLDAYSRVEHSSGPLQSLSDTARTVQRGYKQPPSSPSPLHPSPSHIMRTDAYLHVRIPSEPPQSPLDATRVTEQGYKPPQPPSTPSPSCKKRMEAFPWVVDVSHTTTDPLGRISTRFTRFTHPTPFVSCTARFDTSKRVENLCQVSVDPPCRLLMFSLQPRSHPATSDPLGQDHVHSPSPLVSKRMRIASLIASLGDDHHQPTPASKTMQCEVYEGVGDPTFFSPTRTICTCLPPHHPKVPTHPSLMCDPSLTSQDVQTKLLSVVTDSILDTRALLENVSLINEINSVLLHPSWVKRGDVVTSPILGASMHSSNVYLGVNDSHSLQDFYQEPEAYIFDPDPGTRKNDICLRSVRAICPLFHIIWWTFNLPRLLVALTGYQ